ncbi:C-C motif chemokine 4 homolog [Heliangelus exortis]|uniref:C-C motif chemokine 4 homolog n=1 Tax=Heliangelus exortis TaxID=472823 RepID=UPI003A911215
MKNSVLLLALLATCCCHNLAAPLGSDPPTSCCFTYTSRQLPRSFVVEYYETNSQCPQAAVVFVTRRGRQVCADPEQSWVQQYVSDLELN